MTASVIVIGAGGHTKVLLSALQLRGVKILGILDIDPSKFGTTILGIPVLGGDDLVTRYSPHTTKLVNGIGSNSSTALRQKIFEKFCALGYNFAGVTHTSAIISRDVTLGEGSQLMAGSVIQPGTTIGVNSIINTCSSVDHDCVIGAHVHVAPGATLSGNVTVGDGTHIGTGAVVIQGLTIGENCMIGAGAVVIKDTPSSVRVAGIPAREM